MGINYTEMDTRSKDMWAHITGILDEQNHTLNTTSEHRIHDIPDLGTQLQMRFGDLTTARVIDYVGETIETKTPSGIALEQRTSEKLRGVSLIVEDTKKESYFLMALFASNVPATSTMSYDQPQREELINRFGVLPVVHNGDTKRGILFQGYLSYSQNTNINDIGTIFLNNQKMEFEYAPEYLPPNLPNIINYQNEQKENANRFLTKKDATGRTPIQQILDERFSNLRR